VSRPAPLELALHALCWIAVLCIGSVHPETQVGLACASLLLLVCYAIGPGRNRGLRLPPLAWVSIAALLWTGLQLLPLPVALIGKISPVAAELRADLGARWAPITLDVPATTLELAKQLTYLCALLVGCELFRRRGALRAAASLALLGCFVAILIVAHRALGAERIYGLYNLRSHPGGGLFYAPFVNGNHAASLLALAALAAAGVAVMSEGGRRAVFSVVSAIAALATLGTTSRGGVIGLAIGALGLVTQLAVSHYGRKRGLVLSAAVVVLLGAGGLVLGDGLRARFTQHQTGATLTENQKTRGWLAAFRLANRYPITGVGRGAFEAPVALVRPTDDAVRLVFPENILCQWVAEWGYPVGLGLLATVLLLLGSLLTRLKLDPALAGLSAGIAAVAVHELFDFGLEFPGVALPFTLALAAMVGSAEGDRSERRRARPRLGGAPAVAALLAAVAILVAAGQACRSTLTAELSRLRAAIDARDPEVKAAIDAACARHPASAELEVLAGEVALRRRDPSALRRLGRAMRLQPASPRPHHLAAIELLRVRRVGQAALELRLALEKGAIISNADLVRLVGSRAVDAAPRDVDGLFRLGAELARLGRWDDLEHAYQRAAELDPGPGPRRRWLALLPPQRGGPAAEALARAGTSGEELALAVNAFVAAGQVARAEAVLQEGIKRYPNSAALVVAGARLRAQRGDLEGARQLIGRSARFDAAGGVLIEELRIELAEKAKDPDAAFAARARLRLLRQRANLDEPAGGETK